MKKKISLIGIIYTILYFLAVGLFLIAKTETALTIWEIATIIGAPVILLVLIELANFMDVTSICKNAMLAFMSCTCSLTAVAHIVNITVTRKLLAQGVDIPEFLQIGFWPSVEMATDYLAWGFFMGLAFLSIGISIQSSEKPKILMKRIVIICSILCLAGFWGTVFVNENLWYLAPMGYGFGTIIICVQMIKMKKSEKLLTEFKINH